MSLGSLIQTMIALVVVLAVALALGFRPSAGRSTGSPLFGLLTLVTLAVIWLAVALGLVTDNVETASNLPMPLFLLPFLGSGFVPHRLDAGRDALVRRIPAVHPDHGDRARAAAGHPDRLQRRAGRRLVGRRRLRRLPVGEAALQPVP